MRRRLLVAATVGLTALVPLAGAAAAPRPLRLAPLTTPFPTRAFMLTLPARMALTTGTIHITEDGAPVNAPSVAPASAFRRLRLGVVLAIDASDSMRGRSIDDALVAARTFAAHMARNERLAVMAFNQQAQLVQGFTHDPNAVRSALRTAPPLGAGTHIYDAVASAISMIRRDGDQTGAVVVLSDGADTGSITSVDQLVRAAPRAHVRVYTVGIRSRAFDAASLQRLAAQTNASFAVAGSSRELPVIYDRLGSELADQYVIRYRSTAPPNHPVRVEVRVDGVQGRATATYTAPPLPPVPPAFRRPLSLTFWQSTTSLAVAIGMVSALVALAAALLLRPRSPSVRARMAAFVSLPEATPRERPSARIGKVLDGADRTLANAGWWADFKAALEIADIQTPAIRLVAASFAGALVVSLIGAAISPWAMPLGLVVPVAVWMFVNRRVERKRQAFAEQLPDNLQVLASALRAGHSLVGALSVVVDDCAEPARSEFRRVIADEQLGVPLEDALNTVVERMANRDLAQVALVAALQRQTGGNTAEVLDRVTETVRDRFKLRGLVRTLTAQGRISRWIVTALPILLTGVILVINPHYFDPLIGKTIGRLLIAAAVVMVIAGSFVIRRIVNIKV